MSHVSWIPRFRFTWFLLALALLLGVGILAFSLFSNSNALSVEFIGSQFTELSESLRSMGAILTTVRLSILAGLFFSWRKLIQRLAVWCVLSPVAASKLHRSRGRIFVWLLIIELVIGQRLLQHLVDLLSRWL